MAQMVEQVLGENFYKGSWVHIPVREGFSLVDEIIVFEMNPGQDLINNLTRIL